MISFFGIGLGFSLLSPEHASARTNSPLTAPNRFNVKNTSSTVDPGFINSTSRNL